MPEYFHRDSKKVGLGKSAIMVLPYIGVTLVVTLILLAYPNLITYLPNLFM